MEGQLFTWEEWDMMDTMVLCFYDCELKVDIGPYKAGEKLECIWMDYGEGELTTYDDKGHVSCRCKMSLKLDRC
jgi:hypothetical protein